MTGVASAQTAALNTNSAATMHRDGEWRASKLVGVNVYNEANEKVDDINEIILDKSGHVANVILGIGGFLGMGEHYVTVAFDKLKWVNEGVQTTTATTMDGTARTNADDTRRTNTGTATATTTRSANEKWILIMWFTALQRNS